MHFSKTDIYNFDNTIAVPDAVAKCRSAGIKVVMVTGMLNFISRLCGIISCMGEITDNSRYIY